LWNDVVLKVQGGQRIKGKKSITGRNARNDEEKKNEGTAIASMARRRKGRNCGL